MNDTNTKTMNTTNNNTILRAELRTGVTMIGPAELVLAWVGEQLSYRPDEIEPVAISEEKVILSEEQADEADVPGLQWAR